MKILKPLFILTLINFLSVNSAPYIRKPVITLINNSTYPVVNFEIETASGLCERKDQSKPCRAVCEKGKKSELKKCDNNCEVEFNRSILVPRGQRGKIVDFNDCPSALAENIIRVIAKQPDGKCIFVTNYSNANHIIGCSEHQPNTKGIENQFYGNEEQLIVTLEAGIRSQHGTLSEIARPTLTTKKP